MVKVSENENMNGDEKGQRTNWDVFFDNPVFREMCEAAEEAAEEAEKTEESLKKFFNVRLKLLERDLLRIMENELERQKAKYADAPKAVSEFLENVLMESLCSVLGSANVAARLWFLNERPAEDSSDAFTEWLKARGVKFETRLRLMKVRKDEPLESDNA